MTEYEEKEVDGVGCCPFCGSENLEYGEVEFECDSLYYPFKCRDCGAEGREWHSVEPMYTEATREKREPQEGDVIDELAAAIKAYISEYLAPELADRVGHGDLLMGWLLEELYELADPRELRALLNDRKR